MKGISPIAVQIHHDGRPQREKYFADLAIERLGLERVDVSVATPTGTQERSTYRLNRGFTISTGILVGLNTGASLVVMADRLEDWPQAGTSIHRAIALAALMEHGRAPSLWLPFWNLTKSEIRHVAGSANYPTADSWSCERDAPRECGECAGCLQAAES
jgi:hypothetical protein